MRGVTGLPCVSPCVPLPASGSRELCDRPEGARGPRREPTGETRLAGRLVLEGAGEPKSLWAPKRLPVLGEEESATRSRRGSVRPARRPGEPGLPWWEPHHTPGVPPAWVARRSRECRRPASSSSSEGSPSAASSSPLPGRDWRCSPRATSGLPKRCMGLKSGSGSPAVKLASTVGEPSSKPGGRTPRLSEWAAWFSSSAICEKWPA
mmetsp:Transcript_38553/g.98591  ORF Transcript_38553/g.98591 Transcript_38553/m.98591 type:complete len:207 (-) Transcript_38553:1225-1845(-)